MKLQTLTVAALLCAAACTADAHDGRRLKVFIVDGQLVAQGYNSTGADDGGGTVRPYYNALHDHWSNNLVGPNASADLPGFDVFDPGALVGHGLTLTFHGATKWVNPPIMPPMGTVPVLDPLGVGEQLFVSFDTTTVSTETPGDLVLAPSIGSGGALDLDLAYEINSQPAGVIYVLECTMSTDAPGIADSDTLYLMLSPDGNNAVEKLHHASLFLEQFLGTPIPGTCPGDIADDFGTLGADGMVSFGDFLALLGLVGPCPGGTPGCAGDIADDFGTLNSGDGMVGFGDFLALLGLVGPCP